MKRLIAFLCAALLLCSLLPSYPAQAEGKPYGSVPILIGDPVADLLAEKILAGINTSGLNDKDKIQRVYDWIILNCVRESSDGSDDFTPKLTVTEQEVSEYSHRAGDMLARGEAVVRKELVEQYTDYSMAGHEDFMYWPDYHDTNDYISAFGSDMMVYRVGNCAHFSSMLAILLGHLGYDVRLIPGEFINRNGTRVMHKWNCVLVGDQYYWLDVRIDDNVTSGTNVTHYYFYESNTDTWAKQHNWVRGYTDLLQWNVASIKAQYADPPVHTHVFENYDFAESCTEEHWTGQYCTVCGAYIVDWVPATGHKWNQNYGRVPTCTESGYAFYSCSVCGETKSEDLPALGHSWSLEKILSEPEGSSHGTASYLCARCGENKQAPLCSSEVFVDAPQNGNWAHAGVDWAFITGITKGTTDTTFSPEQTCTRGQVVTFLWRAAGSPEPEALQNGKAAEQPFTDVREKDYFYKAVLWAIEQGITTGTTETTFSPGDSCIRAQVVTFLWRAHGSPEQGTQLSNPFKDVPQNSYYSQAVLWAVENEITTGMSSTEFSPKLDCTRAQVVTFLLRGEKLNEQQAPEEPEEPEQPEEPGEPEEPEEPGEPEQP